MVNSGCCPAGWSPVPYSDSPLAWLLLGLWMAMVSVMGLPSWIWSLSTVIVADGVVAAPLTLTTPTVAAAVPLMLSVKVKLPALVGLTMRVAFFFFTDVPTSQIDSPPLPVALPILNSGGCPPGWSLVPYSEAPVDWLLLKLWMAMVSVMGLPS